MKKLNFEEYMDCLDLIENPLQLWDYLKEDTDPNIDTMTEEESNEMTIKMKEYMEEQITPTQKLCIQISIDFGIPYDQVIKLPKEIGVYLAATIFAKSKKEKEAEAEKPTRPTIADQIATAKGSPQSPTPKIKPEQIADFLRAIGIGI